MSIAQEQADIQRAEAKRLLRNRFGINDGESDGNVERIIDCIISAALLEMAAIQEAAIRSHK